MTDPTDPNEIDLPGLVIAGRVVSGLTCDSRAVKPGWLFAAFEGSQVDGREYIGAAVEAGASVILAKPGTPVPAGAVLLPEESPRQAFAHLAAQFHGVQPATQAAVTGTNGKTSVASFLRQIWRSAGETSASIGTLGLVADGFPNPGGLTTPDPEKLSAQLAALAEHGVTHLAIEASSHGLDQFRLDGLEPRACGFTNLSRDHLDYHGDMESYFTAKARLFTDLLAEDGTAVINADDAYGQRMIEICAGRGLAVIDYGKQATKIAITQVRAQSFGLELGLEVEGEATYIDLPLIGAFQAWNALCAAGLAAATGLDLQRAIGALMDLEGAPGRMEPIGEVPGGGAVFVDYAHTPDALETALKALRPHCAGRLYVVFGAGGDRDKGKRPLMGEKASTFADGVIVTDDNPRSEDPAAIRAEIIAAAPKAHNIADRAVAIQAGLESLTPGDILLIAGKGHETGQTVGTEILPFDDRALARTLIGAETPT
ncbi:MAG: UDP-N-acetylmuramoyl-L-alanyl-D-glutamate--2,6-diaminopimelate ligase [Magnetovibrionaceae bacterium]